MRKHFALLLLCFPEKQPKTYLQRFVESEISQEDCLTDLQKQTALAIVNIFETGKVTGNYSAVTVIPGDGGHLSYGRSQTTLASGNLYTLLSSYCAQGGARYAAQLKLYLSRLEARNIELDKDKAFQELLTEAGKDPVMQSEQDLFFERNYFLPACRTAQAKGITTPLGQTVIYDSFIQGGFTRIANSLGAMVTEKGVGEQKWIQRYLSARKAWLGSLKAPLPTTAYRVDAFQALISQNAWDLALDLTVRGVLISPSCFGSGITREPVSRSKS